ncbi:MULTISPECIES: hypothetical protein [Asticcacaulis]|uniref:hypothetical protein n=1 Tax=Asticcacaulis TaxID=76890 RepID=UPI001AE437A8|nr:MULTISPECIES: hypothetical protein [Asticcacaulis]MBP2157780.1 hypothetical protein [Asticcacaulis solisilvae]MDR6798825.1 hypothetical protein [Asticcacaulis sp. BE141]
MKRILALFCLALTVAPVGAQADTLHDLVQGLDTAVVVKIGGDQERRRPGRDRDDRDDRGNNGGSNWRDSRDNDRGGAARREDRNDGRIGQAMAIARSRGFRVLDAGQQSGSIFWVRAAAPDGRRVDLLVDADSGRIVGER